MFPSIVLLTLGSFGIWLSESRLGIFPELVGPSAFMLLIGLIFLPAGLFKDGLVLTSRGRAVVGIVVFVIIAEVIAYLVSVA